MTEKEIEKEADEDWAVWRKWQLSIGGNPSKFSEIDLWQHAYRFGIELGRELGPIVELRTTTGQQS